MTELSRREKGYLILDLIDEGRDYNEVLNYSLLYFPDLDWESRGDLTLRQFILEEVINR